MSDLIDRQAAIDAAERQIKDCNPEHFIGQPKFIEYMDDEYIGSFGQWQFANGFNMGLTAAEVTTKQLPSAQPEIIRCKECKWSEPVNNRLVCGAWDAKAVDGDDYCSDAERRIDGSN